MALVDDLKKLALEAGFHWPVLTEVAKGAAPVVDPKDPVYDKACNQLALIKKDADAFYAAVSKKQQKNRDEILMKKLLAKQQSINRLVPEAKTIKKSIDEAYKGFSEMAALAVKAGISK